MSELNRREFFQTRELRLPRLRPPPPGKLRQRVRLVRPADALGAAGVRRRRSRPITIPQFWLDYFRRIHADAACLSAGGCVAFYPTKVPLHYRSKYLGDTDAFGEMVAGCRKLGMNVIARTDPHAAHQDVYDAHPDWIAVDAEGKKRRHWADPDLWVTCALGPYNFELHDRRHHRDRPQLQGRWHLHQSLGRLRHVLLRALPVQLSRVLRHETCPAPPTRRIPRAGSTSSGSRQRLFDLWRLWDTRDQEDQPERRVTSPTPAAARSATWT